MFAPGRPCVLLAVFVTLLSQSVYAQTDTGKTDKAALNSKIDLGNNWYAETEGGESIFEFRFPSFMDTSQKSVFRTRKQGDVSTQDEYGKFLTLKFNIPVRKVRSKEALRKSKSYAVGVKLPPRADTKKFFDDLDELRRKCAFAY